MRLDRRGIESRIPHKGAMCLLDSVLAWDLNSIRCASSTHRDVHNPLRAGDRLAGVCGIEYAAQAMAIHGALQSAAAPPRAGVIASVRNVDIQVAYLDDIVTDLIATANRIGGDDSSVMYDFNVLAADKVLLSGRATVVLNTEAFAWAQATRGNR